MELLRALNFSPVARPEVAEWDGIKDLEISGHLALPI
jgi:hypothetical protein